MPPKLALFLCFLFIGYLLWTDLKRRPPVSSALWIPTVWIMITGSRFLAEWFQTGSSLTTEDALLEGSPLDRAMFSFLMIAGFCVLIRRKIEWSTIIRNNQWVVLWLLWGAISIVWSDFPWASFKRWDKTVGNIIVILVVLSEQNPVEATKALLRRCAYVLIPLSIVFIKYFPELGRSFSPWTGEAMNTGVTINKNALGYLCLVSGLYFLWDLVTLKKGKQGYVERGERFNDFLLLAMTVWLIIKAHSATSTITFILGAFILLIIGASFIKRNPRALGWYLIFIVIFVGTFQLLFDIQEEFLSLVGRSETLTGRTELWKVLLGMGTNPIIGTGFESFWLGERLDKIWAIYSWRPVSAHNGYIETYLNTGLIGLALLGAMIISTYRKSARELLTDFDHGRFRIALLVVLVVYNITEATFKGAPFMASMFLLIAIDYRHQRKSLNNKIFNWASTPAEEDYPTR